MFLFKYQCINITLIKDLAQQITANLKRITQNMAYVTKYYVWNIFLT